MLSGFQLEGWVKTVLHGTWQEEGYNSEGLAKEITV